MDIDRRDQGRGGAAEPGVDVGAGTGEAGGAPGLGAGAGVPGGGGVGGDSAGGLRRFLAEFFWGGAAAGRRNPALALGDLPPVAPAPAPVAAVASEAPAGRSVRAWPMEYTRRLIVIEVCAVLAVSLGRSAVSAVLDLAGSLASTQPLSSQQATLNGSESSQQWLNLAWQVYGVAFGLAPVLMVAYLLMREGAGLWVLGVDRRRPWPDLGWGALVAALIGGSGLVLYLSAHAAGLAFTVVPESLPAVWWRVPVLIASAFQNAALEEVVVLGFLVRRFDQLGWTERRGDLTSALVRGSYHLYQGFGGFVGNFIMGVIFARLYRRWGRVMPLLLAHGLIDTTTFVGYVFLAGHVSWLPV